MTLVSIAGLMAAVAVAACFWPARRATRLIPSPHCATSSTALRVGSTFRRTCSGPAKAGPYFGPKPGPTCSRTSQTEPQQEK